MGLDTPTHTFTLMTTFGSLSLHFFFRCLFTFVGRRLTGESCSDRFTMHLGHGATADIPVLFP